ncbi:TonB-dependent receptor plug domain-containing protein [Microbulbifer taiwanensis]|uniref:TonB-dependent receptor plug domain-containing protein n=1 Tax=Microbulbifer taiwanensis TaxID=986746 RepID=UPI0036090445
MKRHPLAAALLGLLSAPNLYAEDGTTKAADDLELIVVSGRAEKPLKDVAGSVSVVTGDEIEKLQINDMNQLFRYQPGVEVTGRAGGAQNILVRGMGGDRVLIVKDGMRMNEGYGANGLNDVVGRGMIETDTLKQVEVAKGAASSSTVPTPSPVSSYLPPRMPATSWPTESSSAAPSSPAMTALPARRTYPPPWPSAPAVSSSCCT